MPSLWINLLLIFLYLCSNVLDALHQIHSEAEVESVRVLADGNETDAAGTGSHENKQPYRTGYHFQPPKHWMSDPNGPMMYKGIYHFFYQYNPLGAVWGNIVWAHSTSTDLVNWKSLPFAFAPSEDYDKVGVWSGSATILADGRPAMLYTGAVNKHKKQVQVLAFPEDLSDKMLTKWVKAPQNPVIEPDEHNKINSTSFRDPSTAWIGQDGEWRIAVASQKGRRGLALLFKSKDFVKWTMVNHPLHFKDGNGMWECNDFYPVARNGRQEGVDTSSPDIKPEAVKYVFKVSLDEIRKDYYTIGSYDKAKDVYVPEKGSIENEWGYRYDYGKFYASKTFYDSDKKRRILWGFINESSLWQDDVKKGWHGLQNVPRTVWLDKSGKQLVQWPVEELKQLRGHHVGFSRRSLAPKSVHPISGITAAQADIEASFNIPKESLIRAEVLRSRKAGQLLCSEKGANAGGKVGPFGLRVLASEDMKEYTAVYFRVFRTGTKYAVLMCSDQSRSSLNEKHDKTTYGAFVDVDPLKELNLRILVDHSVVESFGGNGKTVITARVYPTKAIGHTARMFAFNDGNQTVSVSKLRAWSMHEAKIN